MTTEESPLFETMGRTLTATVEPSTLHIVEIQENEYLHGFWTYTEGLEHIDIEERQYDDYRTEIRITNNDKDFSRTVFMFIRKKYPTSK